MLNAFTTPTSVSRPNCSAKKETIHQRKHLEKSLDSILSRAPPQLQKAMVLAPGKRLPQAGCPPCPLSQSIEDSNIEIRSLTMLSPKAISGYVQSCCIFTNCRRT